MQRCPYCHQALEDGLLPICWHCGRDTQIAPSDSSSARTTPDASGHQATDPLAPFAFDQLIEQLGLEPDVTAPMVATPQVAALPVEPLPIAPPSVAPPATAPLLVDPIEPPPVPAQPVAPPAVTPRKAVARVIALPAALQAFNWRKYRIHMLGAGGLGAAVLALSLMGRPQPTTQESAPAPAPARATAPAAQPATASPAAPSAQAPAAAPAQTRAAQTPAPPAQMTPAPARPAGAAAQTAANVQIDEAPGWVIPRRTGFASDGSRTLTLHLAALRELQVNRQHIRPVLAVRCLSRRTEVFVSLGTSAGIEAGDTNRVTVQIDDQPPSAQQWLRTDTYQELFAPDGLAMARQLASASLLRFTFTPFSSRPVVAEFNVKGFEQHVATLARPCGWPSPGATQARKR